MSNDRHDSTTRSIRKSFTPGSACQQQSLRNRLKLCCAHYVVLLTKFGPTIQILGFRLVGSLRLFQPAQGTDSAAIIKRSLVAGSPFGQGEGDEDRGDEEGNQGGNHGRGRHNGHGRH